MSVYNWLFGEDKKEEAPATAPANWYQQNFHSIRVE